MNIKESKYNIGVIIGRFQTAYLHESHKLLFDYVCGRHKKVICCIGMGHVGSTARNPLDYHQRQSMISDDYPQIQCIPVIDQHSNELWSKKLDISIEEQILKTNNVPLLYGSRDSFISSYEGKFDTKELESTSFISASQIREEIACDIVANVDVRRGMVLATQNRYPAAYTTVDVAIMRNNNTEILLARKAEETQYRFVGGFSDPNSYTLEDDVFREVNEETGLRVCDIKYICSSKIDDWRYRSEVDCIKTTLWIAVVDGDMIAKADDDIVEVQWFKTSDLTKLLNEDTIVSSHVPLMRQFLAYINKG